MTTRGRVEHLTSAGGVVCRPSGEGVEVVLCGMKSPVLWGLPKGAIEPGESLEEAAIREVVEETGLEVRIQAPISSINYWFARPEEGVRYNKTVHFYLMYPVGGDMSQHDYEFDHVAWFDVQEALKTMTYPSEVKIVEQAVAMVREEARRG